MGSIRRLSVSQSLNQNRFLYGSEISSDWTCATESPQDVSTAHCLINCVTTFLLRLHLCISEVTTWGAGIRRPTVTHILVNWADVSNRKKLTQLWASSVPDDPLSHTSSISHGEFYWKDSCCCYCRLSPSHIYEVNGENAERRITSVKSFSLTAVFSDK